jgi:GTP-binding protein
MIPGDSGDVKKQYDILYKEVKMFNPELLDKERFLVVSKSDLLDEELEQMIGEELNGIPHMFISVVAQTNLDQLKDKLWELLVKTNV